MSSVSASSPWRPARTAAGATISTVTALVAHDLAGGSVPPGIAVALLLGATCVAWSVTAERTSLSQIVGLLVLCQAVVHLGCAGTGDVMVGGPAMLLGHLAATILSATLLRRGERWAWRLASTLALRPLRMLVVASPPAPTRAAAPQPAPSLRSVGRRRTTSVRGPPVVA